MDEKEIMVDINREDAKMFNHELDDIALDQFAKVCVIGIGGSGVYAINRMIDNELGGVDFIAADTDAQILLKSNAQKRIQLGEKITKGLGADGNSGIGERVAQESREKFLDVMRGKDIAFIIAGMGGGTGAGAAPVVAECAHKIGVLTVGVVIYPLKFEGQKCRGTADIGIENLRKHVDSIITIFGDRLLQAEGYNKKPLTDTFKVAANVIYQCVKSISDLIAMPGLINLEFEDVDVVMRVGGSAFMGIGEAYGENAATDAAKKAISSPIAGTSIKGAKRILFNIIGSSDLLTMMEVNDAAMAIEEAADSDSNIVFGASLDDSLGDIIRVTVVATGF